MGNINIPLEHTYRDLPERFYSEAVPSQPMDPQLIKFNYALAEELKISLSDPTDEVLAEVFSGKTVLNNSHPIAQAYAGHQFAHFVPQLGDGRAALLGEVVAKNGHRLDVQLKGSGPTVFSRGGDGKSPLGPVVREYIVSEAMHVLGVPTSRALAAVATGEFVQREEALPGAVFTRVAESHIRVGTFQYFLAREDLEALSKLFTYTIGRHYSEISGAEDLHIQFLKAVMEKQAQLVARWMSLGFIHGVMNTDNFSVAGITIDYGPCAFLDEFDPDKVFSSIDRRGRYSYSNQPDIAQWNLARLAECLIPLMSGSRERAKEQLEEVLISYPERFNHYWLQEFSQKLGLSQRSEQAKKLVKLWLEYLAENQLDFTLAFRKLPELLRDDPEPEWYPSSEKREEFVRSWKVLLAKENLKTEQVTHSLVKNNPLYIPRNHIIERIIQKANGGDFTEFEKIVEVLANPFVEQENMYQYALPPEPKQAVRQTFCGT